MEWNELRNSSYQVILNIIPLLLACESMGSIQNGAGLPVRYCVCVCVLVSLLRKTWRAERRAAL